MFERVERCEGSSDKFWEICVEGADVTTRWGSAGTTGQSKTKSYASEPTALAEAEKLLQEKLRKGYRRVEPSREEVTVELPREHDWQDELRQLHGPWRRDGVSRALDPKARLKELQASLKKELPTYRAGLGLTAPTLQKAARTACAFLSGEPVELDVEAGAALLALTERQAAVYLSEALPPVQVLEVLLTAERFSHSARYAQNGICARWILRSQGLQHNFGPVPVAPWAALRQTLAGCSEEAYLQARGRAQELYRSADYELRCRLAFTFPDAGWAETEARYGLQHQVTLYGNSTMLPLCTWFTLGSLLDFDLLTQLMDHPLAGPDPFFAPFLLGNFGRKAFPMLMKRPGWRGFLWEVPDPELAGQLRALLDDRSERAHLTQYVQRWPHLGIPMLAHVLATNGKGKEVARTLLSQLLQKTETLPPLEPREERVCRDLMGRMRSRQPAADESELPPVLRQPPWLARRKPRQRKVVELPALPAYKERILWEGRKPKPYRREIPPLPSPLDDKLCQALKRSLERGNVSIWELDQLSDPAALPFWNETPADKWQYPDHHDLDAMLVRFGLEGLPGCLTLAESDTECLTRLLRVDSPRVAGVMAKGMATQKGRRTARSWMERYPRAAALGMVALAVGPLGPEREAAEKACLLLPREEVLKAGELLQATEALAEVLAVDPLEEVPARIPRLPAFFDLALLPAPRLKNGSPLGAKAITNLATMLAFSPLDPPYAGLEQVKATCDAEEFAWELFSLWLTAGGPAKEKWAFLALGHLGGDETARRLAPMMKSWPQAGLFARAELGLDVLGAIGTDIALMHIHQMSQKLKSKALQDKARLKLDEIAARRGLSTDELADRLVPDLGLDVPLGGGVRIVFDEQLRPGLVAADGKTLKDLPRSAAEEDVQRWKALKKDAKAVAQSQLLRMELAMSGQRRWPLPTWRLCLLEHPLLVHMVRRLVWGCYREEKLVETFRVAEDSTLANVEDAPFELPQDALVGLPHPLELDPGRLSQWGQVLGDYAILQPFPQLGRAVYRLDPDESQSDRLVRFEGRKLAALRLLGLEGRGWRRGRAEDAGAVITMEKSLGPRWTACLEFEPGFYVALPKEAEEQRISRVTVQLDERPRKLGEASPFALSDLIADLESLR